MTLNLSLKWLLNYLSLVFPVYYLPVICYKSSFVNSIISTRNRNQISSQKPDFSLRLNGIQWSWVQIPLRPTFYSYFKESVSSEYHMYQLILLHSCAYLQKTSIKINVATNEDKQPKSNVTLNKRWNWNRCTKFALSVSWTHGLIAQLVRASERNSMVVGSNPTQTNFL